jgi:hypothetical protein
MEKVPIIATGTNTARQFNKREVLANDSVSCFSPKVKKNILKITHSMLITIALISIKEELELLFS